MGDSIAIAPTDYYQSQAEDAVITAITPVAAGFQLTLATQLTASHQAAVFSGVNPTNAKRYSLNACAEVAMLSRCVSQLHPLHVHGLG